MTSTTVYEPLYHAREIATIKLSSGCSFREKSARSRNSSSLFVIKQLFHSSLLATDYIYELGPFHMSPATGLAQLAGRSLFSVHMGNFTLVTEMKKARFPLRGFPFPFSVIGLN